MPLAALRSQHSRSATHSPAHTHARRTARVRRATCDVRARGPSSWMEALEGGAWRSRCTTKAHMCASRASQAACEHFSCYLRDPRSMSAVGAAQMSVVHAAADKAHAQHGCGGVQQRRAHMHGRV